MSSTSDIRVLTIGTSMITGMFADAVRDTDGIRIEAVFSRDLAKARSYAAGIGAPLAGDDLDALLSRVDIDAVYVGSPNSAHAAQVRAAITAGKHVFVEKPAVLAAAEWDELVDAASAADVLLFEGMRTEYDPGTALVRSLLPEIGVLRSATLRYQSRSSRYDKVLAGEYVNMFAPEMGGGAVNDLGVYVIRAALTLFGEPETVSATLLPVRSGVEGAGHIVLGYDGSYVALDFSKITTSRLPSELQGEDGTLTIDHIASARRVTLTRRNGEVSEHHLDLPQHSLLGEVARFVELISTDADPTRDQALTGAVLRIIESCRSSVTSA
ncbi:Gfo/Idh/MocA family oxidoreductase [Microbacterium sediminicola]|uniref:Gfo/Idh/MocA family protein n=1 Tax=Microbacterium sediminicola TaxID=415210 RepID=UPI0031DC2440